MRGCGRILADFVLYAPAYSWGCVTCVIGFMLGIAGTAWFHDNENGCVWIRYGACMAALGSTVMHRTFSTHPRGLTHLFRTVLAVQTLAWGFVAHTTRQVTAVWINIEPDVWTALPNTYAHFYISTLTLWLLYPVLLLHGGFLLYVVRLLQRTPRADPYSDDEFDYDQPRCKQAFALSLAYPLGMYLFFGAAREIRLTPFLVRASEVTPRAIGFATTVGLFFIAAPIAVHQARRGNFLKSKRSPRVGALHTQDLFLPRRPLSG